VGKGGINKDGKEKGKKKKEENRTHGWAGNERDND
jgi:hypothetical protein